jgi:hypothetical protein
MHRASHGFLDSACSADKLVISYRNHHHAFADNDKTARIINRAARLTAPRRLLQFIFSMVMVHYFLWIVPMVGSLYLFYSIGLWWISVIMLAVYIPTFINNDQFKKGRPWDGFRQSSLWRLTSRYIGIEVIRTKKLDPSKKYIFGFYPHGILILSRIAMYGGVWEKLFPGIETRVLGASPMFWLPGSREICLWMGAVSRTLAITFGMNYIWDESHITPSGMALSLSGRRSEACCSQHHQEIWDEFDGLSGQQLQRFATFAHLSLQITQVGAAISPMAPISLFLLDPLSSSL